PGGSGDSVRVGCGARAFSAGARHRQVSRREDGSRDNAGIPVAMRVFGSLRVPGDKSISHRALIFGALGDGPSRVTGILQSADVHSTAGVLRSLGVAIPELTLDVVVQGVGRDGLKQPRTDLDCGNSGTTTR